VRDSGSVRGFERASYLQRDFERFTLGYTVVMLTNYVCYILVPAIGPRFYLAGNFVAPLHGLYFGPILEHAFKASPYFRDCFPSGHTALTLYCLYNARKLTPRLFRVMLVPALGLITATLVCRFHYGVDVLCGPLLTTFAVVVAEAITRRQPVMTMVDGRRVSLESLERS